MINREEWNRIFTAAFQGSVDFDMPMKKYTYLGIGGPADVVVSPEDPLSLRNAVSALKAGNIPFVVLGGGTNVLASDDGIEGVVILLRSFRRIEELKAGNGFSEIFVEAGVPLPQLVSFCRERGYAGIEGLAGIPGTVGGAICGNAGAFGCEIKDVLDSVAIMNASGRLDRFKAAGLGFRYRGSDISENDIVLSANMKLRADDQQAVARRTDEYMAEKKRRQPLAERSAGCVFKNPAEVPAGQLIDEAGCKGMTVGGVQVSTVHANFFINAGNGTAQDYRDLMAQVTSAVKNRTGIVLEPEIRQIGRT